MLYDMLIGTFEEGEWLVGIMLWFLLGICIALFIALGWGLAHGISHEVAWGKRPSFECQATLISNEYVGSTRQTNAVPVVTGKGVGVGIVTTGHGEEYITIWDCGKYGRLKSDKEKIFRFAKPQATLYLKTLGDETRIVGMRESE